jgi:hypothetical protein
MSADKAPADRLAELASIVDAVPVATWPAGWPVILSSAAPVVAAADSDVRAACCAVCGQQAGQVPVIVKVVVDDGPCMFGDRHMPAVAVVVHYACDLYGDAWMIERITAVAAECFGRTRG